MFYLCIWTIVCNKGFIIIKTTITFLCNVHVFRNYIKIQVCYYFILSIKYYFIYCMLSDQQYAYVLSKFNV